MTDQPTDKPIPNQQTMMQGYPQGNAPQPQQYGQPGQPIPGQPIPGQPMTGQPIPRQPMPGQPMYQPMPGQPMPGQPMYAQPGVGYMPQCSQIRWYLWKILFRNMRPLKLLL